MKVCQMKNGKNQEGMNRTLCIGIVALALALVPGFALSFDDHPAPYILKVEDDSKKKEESSVQTGGYDPATVYPGIFKSDQLYTRNPEVGTWMGSGHPAHLKQVSCPAAKERLSGKGLWSGNLNKDGSCGSPPEPADWALGNLLNYLDSLSMEESVSPAE